MGGVISELQPPLSSTPLCSIPPRNFFADALPGINSLAQMIQSRRRRDGLIVGLTVGICTLLLLTYIWR